MKNTRFDSDSDSDPDADKIKQKKNANIPANVKLCESPS